MRQIKEWIETRIGLDELIRSQLTEYRVPKNLNLFYTLGMMAFAAFMIQVITGILLLTYYVPQEEHAFKSIQTIMNVVPYGWLFRLMHVVGSNLMVAVVFLHMGSVFFLGAYKKPRELTWVVGALLLFTTLTFCLSGYLLAMEPVELLGHHRGHQYSHRLSFLWRFYLSIAAGKSKCLPGDAEPVFCLARGAAAGAAHGALRPARLYGEAHRHIGASLWR